MGISVQGMTADISAAASSALPLLPPPPSDTSVTMLQSPSLLGSKVELGPGPGCMPAHIWATNQSEGGNTHTDVLTNCRPSLCPHVTGCCSGALPHATTHELGIVASLRTRYALGYFGTCPWVFPLDHAYFQSQTGLNIHELMARRQDPASENDRTRETKTAIQINRLTSRPTLCASDTTEGRSGFAAAEDDEWSPALKLDGVGMMDLPNGQSGITTTAATVSEKSSSSESLSDKGSSDLKKSFDAVVFDVLKVTPEEYAGQITLMDAPVFKAIQPEVSCIQFSREKRGVGGFIRILFLTPSVRNHACLLS
ncbi:Ras-specific guanine nucleotide-releasing factor RalGPS1 [Larimichthys crocea]|uniref:Uncharacterized protein n=1 Tax=Larimichthys crocea TaxID=215358 RepID=A0ACD3RME1_LARCR|nr:Ras-specific guanine nucleotide-releasing factor RalGPS1 [Larimichthys crocea]